jgi:hypothetical protein
MRYMRWLMDRVYPAPQLLSELGVPPVAGADAP